MKENYKPTKIYIIYELHRTDESCSILLSMYFLTSVSDVYDVYVGVTDRRKNSQEASANVDP